MAWTEILVVTALIALQCHALVIQGGQVGKIYWLKRVDTSSLLILVVIALLALQCHALVIQGGQVCIIIG